MDSWHHDMHYKVKVKTGEYKFGDNDDKLGEVELIIKVPMLEKEDAENVIGHADEELFHEMVTLCVFHHP